MVLLIITPAFYPAMYYGGPIYSSYELAKALKKNGVDVRVITTNSNGTEKLKIKTGVWHKLDNDLPVKYHKSLDSRGTSISMFFNLWMDINKSDLVYLISIFSASTPLTILLCSLLKKPLIITSQGQLGIWCLEQGSRFKKLWLQAFVQPCIPHLNWHLTSSEEEKDVLSVYPTAKTFIMPNGVNQELFLLNDKAKDRTYYNKYTGFDCSNKKIIISMGRLHEVKGFNILIEAIGMIDRKDIILLIAGEDFGERKKLEEMIDKFALKEKVFLIGLIEGSEKIEFLRNADVFALPSHHENFGMVYAEALAAGTPVVASINTPWQDIEKHNCGKWVDSTPYKFAEAIIEILNSDSIQMGKNGSKYVEDNFCWDKIVSKSLRMLKNLTEEKND